MSIADRIISLGYIIFPVPHKFKKFRMDKQYEQNKILCKKVF